jgi:hypothetical protein
MPGFRAFFRYHTATDIPITTARWQLIQESVIQWGIVVYHSGEVLAAYLAVVV